MDICNCRICKADRSNVLPMTISDHFCLICKKPAAYWWRIGDPSRNVPPVPSDLIDTPLCLFCYSFDYDYNITKSTLEIRIRVLLNKQTITFSICDCGAKKANTTHANWCSTYVA